jgi:hypothetical protein
VSFSSTTEALRAALIDGRNSDGGWGYGRGKASRLEPTALALVALDAVAERVDGSVLRRWPRASALLVDPSSGQVNIAHNAIAAVAAQVPSLGVSELAGELVDSLLKLKGVKLPPSTTVDQDNSLEGWPWVTETFSWLEPTAWVLLALRRQARINRTTELDRRIDQAQRLVSDRACRTGGWNYGNANVLGRDLFPYVSTTALALIAMQRLRSDNAVRRSQAWLYQHRLAERSGLALSLTQIALTLQEASPDDVAAAVHDTWKETAFLGNQMAAALALFALSGAEHGYAALRV